MNVVSGSILFGCYNRPLCRLYNHFTGCPFDIIGIVVQGKTDDGSKMTYVYTALDGKIKIINFRSLFNLMSRVYVLELLSSDYVSVEHLKTSLKKHQDIGDRLFGTPDDILHLYPSKDGSTFCDLVCSSLFPDQNTGNIYPKSFLTNIMVPSFDFSLAIQPEEKGMLSLVNAIRGSRQNPMPLPMTFYARYLTFFDSVTGKEPTLDQPSLISTYCYLALLKKEASQVLDLEYYESLYRLLSCKSESMLLVSDGVSPKLPNRVSKDKVNMCKKVLETLDAYSDASVIPIKTKYKDLYIRLTQTFEDFIAQLTS